MALANEPPRPNCSAGAHEQRFPALVGAAGHPQALRSRSRLSESRCSSRSPRAPGRPLSQPNTKVLRGRRTPCAGRGGLLCVSTAGTGSVITRCAHSKRSTPSAGHRRKPAAVQCACGPTGSKCSEHPSRGHSSLHVIPQLSATASRAKPNFREKNHFASFAKNSPSPPAGGPARRL